MSKAAVRPASSRRIYSAPYRSFGFGRIVLETLRACGFVLDHFQLPRVATMSRLTSTSSDTHWPVARGPWPMPNTVRTSLTLIGGMGGCTVDLQREWQSQRLRHATERQVADGLARISLSGQWRDAVMRLPPPFERGRPLACRGAETPGASGAARCSWRQIAGNFLFQTVIGGASKGGVDKHTR